MAATLINLSGFSFGLTDETGINAESVDIEAESKEIEVPDVDGDDRGLVLHAKKAQVTISGEVTGNTGVAAASIGAALTVANIEAVGGVSTGNVYTKRVAINLNRENLKKITVNATRYPGF